MSELPAFPRMSFLLLCILGMTLVTSGFPQPRLPLRRPDNSEEAKRDDWDVYFPSISLRDWSIQMTSAPSLGGVSKARLMRGAWLFAPERAEASVERAWPAEWSSPGAGVVKRNMVVADDAAFREKSKLLTSMERQKWLNSYMQKLLVEAVGETLEELWISYNLIEKLKGILSMKKLRVFYMSNNLVKEWGEFVRLADLPCLADLVFVGNPLEEKHTAEGTWMDEASKRLPNLRKLDGTPVIKQEEDDADGES